jgi:hypothetical protein
MDLKAPFPWFGGKKRVAPLIWERFGNCPNYVEPFFGSGAVLLQRPHEAKTETVNDADCYLSNFWRALASDPEGVAQAADWPVNEADLLARHKWLLAQEDFRAQMKTDPHFYDVKIAGWWVWGQCSWIGAGFCHTESAQMPHLGNAGRGINRRLPHLGNAGRGINRRLPHLGNAGQAALPSLSGIYGYFQELSDRLRKVRVCCGDWSRVLGDSVTHKHGITGIFLDPPYASTDRCQTYAVDSTAVAHDVREWAIINGDNPLLRIALCGYEGEHNMPESWERVVWKAAGGFGSQANGQGRENCSKERIYFSPHCIKNSLFVKGGFNE